MQTNSAATPLLSVVVPVYKTERWLRRCLDSLLGQSLEEIEVVCVDDASPDGCAAILAEYAARDARVHVVTHARNEGLFRARLSGVRAARGAYIAFVDSDDYVNLDCYRAALDAADGADMAVLNTVHEDAQGNRYIHPRYASYRFDDCKGQLFSRFFEQRGLCFIWHTVWNKVYRRALFERALPYYEALDGHLIMAEDLCFSVVLFYFAQSIAFSEYSYYFYYQRADASTSLAGGVQKYVKNIGDLRRAFAFAEDFLQKVRASEAVMQDFYAWRSLYGRFWAENVKNSGLSGGELRTLHAQLREAFGGEEPALPSPHESFFYGKTCPFDSRYVSLSDYLCTLRAGECVSFDIFDTLLVRPFYEPKDLFCLLDGDFARESDCDVPFHVLREKGERIARSKNLLGEEVDLATIYEVMASAFGLEPTLLERMRGRELEAELRFCATRRSVQNLFRLLRRRGARILLISDIYLPRPFMEKLLEKNGYTGYERMFLSCESGVTKQSGNLFRAAAVACGVAPEHILHIGDNWESDVVRAQGAGLRTFFYARSVDCLLQRISDIPSTDMYRDYLRPTGGAVNGTNALMRLGVRCSLAVIANRLYDDPFNSYPAGSAFGHDPRFFGYAALGMHLLALTQWIRGESGGRVRFIARDGYLPMRAYALLYGREGTKYLHVSRRALLPVTLLLGGGPALFEVNVAPGETPRSLCSLVRPLLKPAFLRKIAEEELLHAGSSAFGPDIPFTGEAELHHFVTRVLLPNLDPAACARYRSALAGYFSARLNDGDACFDVGYSGRTLHILAKLTGRRLRGLFVHDYGDGARALLAARGVSVQTFYGFAPAVAGHIRELLLSDVAPSCIGYAVEEQGVRPIYEPAYLHYTAAFTLRSVQEAALAFVADMRRIFGDALEGMPLRAAEASAPLEYCLLYSSEEDRALFSPVAFEDRMYTGREPSLLVDLWRRDVGYYLREASVPPQPRAVQPSAGENEGVSAVLHGQPRWKKAVYYWLFDRETFRRKLNGEEGGR